MHLIFYKHIWINRDGINESFKKSAQSVSKDLISFNTKINLFKKKNSLSTLEIVNTIQGGFL